jgi:hypothetical protein
VAKEADDLLKRLLDEVLEGRRALGEGIEGVGNRLDSFRNETLSNFDGVFGRLENVVESEIQAISAALCRASKARPRKIGPGGSRFGWRSNVSRSDLRRSRGGSLIARLTHPSPIERLGLSIASFASGPCSRSYDSRDSRKSLQSSILT